MFSTGKRKAPIWFPEFEEFEKWKKFTGAPEGSFAEFQETINEAKRAMEATGIEVSFVKLSVDEMKQELEKRGLENSQNNRKTCLGMMLQEKETM